MMKIAILDDVQNCVKDLACFALLKDHDVKVFTHTAQGIGQLAIRLAPFEVIVLSRERTAFTRALLQKLPNLKLLVQVGKVSENIDRQTAHELGITVLDGEGDPTSTAELTWTLILAAMRKVPQYSHNLRDGLWQTVSTNPERNTLGQCLKGKTLGIWGFGRIGQLVAHYGQVFGMRVLVWGSEQSRTSAAQRGYVGASSKEHFFAESDVVSLHLRLGDTTRACVLNSDLERLKSRALFVNTSRAELIESGALLAAAMRGQSIALDVVEKEPLPLDSPLLRFDHVLITPHIGDVETQTYALYYHTAFEQVIHFLN